MYHDRSEKLARLRIDSADRPSTPSPALPFRTAGRVRHHLLWPAVLTAGTALFCIGLWVGTHNDETTVAASLKPAGVSATAKPQVGLVSASGYVVARRQATLAAQVTGQVTAILVEEGTRVGRGQVVARLDLATARAGLANARANEQASAAAVKSLVSERQQALRVQERYRELADRGFARRADLEESEARVSVLTARIEQARAARMASAASIQGAGSIVEQHIIRAPFGGTVVNINAQPGEMISPMSAGGFTRTGIATIVDMSSLEIEAEISESYIARIVPGQAVEIVLDAHPDRPFKGTVLAVVPSADRARVTFKVRIGIRDHGGVALPNMAAKVRIAAPAPPIKEDGI